MADSYEIISDEYTVLRQVGVLTDPTTGRELGIQQGAGKVYLKGEVIPASDISPATIEALEDEDHPSHAYVARQIRAVSDEPHLDTARRLGVPFDGYSDMDEEDILAALQVLPSATVSAVKQYEAEQDDPRERIVHFSVGFGQDPLARQEGRVGSELDEEGRDESDKPVADLTTREVPEEGTVQIGDGITGTGDPQIPHGSRAEEEEKPAPRRRSRRTRAQQSSDEGDKEGSGDDE